MSIVHNHHPSIREFGLQDGCPRCEQHSNHPLSLDNDNLAALIERTRRWMRDEGYPRSDTERDAMRNVEAHLRFAFRLERLDALADGPSDFVCGGIRGAA